MTKKCKNNPFNTAIDSCDEIRGYMKQGLSALGRNSSKVKTQHPALIDGSVDIDTAVRSIRPDEPRWDYVVGYSGQAYFLEVHPADTKNVDEMVKKVTWLKHWLTVEAPDLKNLHKCGSYHWIPSGRVKILKTSPQYRKIAANNLTITPLLHLDPIS